MRNKPSLKVIAQRFTYSERAFVRMLDKRRREKEHITAQHGPVRVIIKNGKPIA